MHNTCYHGLWQCCIDTVSNDKTNDDDDNCKVTMAVIAASPDVQYAPFGHVSCSF